MGLMKYCLTLIHPDGKREVLYARHQNQLRQIRSRTAKEILASNIIPVKLQRTDIGMIADIKRRVKS